MSKIGESTTEKRILKNLAIIFLCLFLILFQVFFPHYYYSSSPRRSNPMFQVGMYYVYEQDDIANIRNEVARISNAGFKVIRISVLCDPNNPSAQQNSMTDEFFKAAKEFHQNVALAILNHVDVATIDYYLGRWGGNLTYIQILNEPELSQSWDLGALFTDDEIFSMFDQIYNVVKQHQLTAKLYTNFEPGFILRPSIPIHLSKNLDFVGFDVYMYSFQILSPNFIQLLQKTTNKDVTITEFGMNTNDDKAQSDYIISGLNLFKSMGLNGCWLVYWNSKDTYYGIRDRLAMQTVGEWIAQNTT